MRIPAITLYQPHATLCSLGAKMIETRPKPWNYKGPVAIHSGLHKGWLHMRHAEPFKSVLGVAELQFGAILAVAYMAGCAPSERFKENGKLWVGLGGFGDAVATMTDQERAFGNYEPGRYGYIFDRVKPLPRPVAARGHQGIWYWDCPEEWLP